MEGASNPKMVFAFKKLKSRTAIRDVLAHNFRCNKPKNADPDREKDNIYPKGMQRNINKAMLAYHKNLKGHKPRRNAVWAHEYVISGSREGFQKLGLKKSKAYFKDAVMFLKEMYGDESLLIPTIHFDESTPHLHVVVQPMKDGKLKGKAFTGGSKHAMASLRSKIHKNVAKKYGFERGEPKEKIGHQELSEYYKLVEKELPALKQQKTALEREIIVGQSEVQGNELAITETGSMLNKLKNEVESIKNEYSEINNEINELTETRNNIKSMTLNELNEAVEYLNKQDIDRSNRIRMR